MEWFGCGGRGVEEEDEKGGGDEGDHGGRIDQLVTDPSV